jgi:hypothetical protein
MEEREERLGKVLGIPISHESEGTRWDTLYGAGSSSHAFAYRPGLHT